MINTETFITSTNTEIKYQVFSDNVKVIDSYKYKDDKIKKEFIDYLFKIPQVEKMFVNKRTKKSLIAEWKAHNTLYKFNIYRSRTKDVDLDIKESFFRKLLYNIIAFIFND